MSAVAERRRYPAAGIFDVRDDYLQTRRDDGLAATVTGPVRFAVLAVLTALGRTAAMGWVLFAIIAVFTIVNWRLVSGRQDGGSRRGR